MEPPRPSHDIPTEVFEALNAKILSSIQGQPWSEYKLLERFLASDPLLFIALSKRSCPLETQFYLCVFTGQTDDLLDEMSKITIEFGPDDGLDQSDKHPIHNAITWGTIHIMKLILIYDSGSSSACLLKNRFGETPLHRAVQKGLVSEVKILLSTCWECAGMVSGIRYETALHCALTYDMGYKAFKTLLEWYIIKEEFLNDNVRDWECGDTALDLLVDGYVKTVKELLFQSGSNVCFQGDSWATKEYFVVIKCKDEKSKYEDCVREVTSKTTNRTILSLSVGSRSVITLKVLIRSVMVKGILSVRDSDGYTVFDLLDKIKKRRRAQLMEFVPHEEVECAMGTLVPKWCNEISDAKEQLGDGTETCREGVVAYECIMKQSKHQVNIKCKTAERAKKRALDTIQLQEVSKKQRQNTIAASSSLSSNAHQSLSNLRFLEQVPEPMHKYIHGTEDVEKDGHCGYRVIAMQSGYEAMDAWKQVRTELLIEVVRNEELYMKLMDIGTVAKMRKAFAYCEDDATDPQFWLSLHEAGYAIANAYKAVVVSLSLISGNLTFLPLLKPPPEGRPHRIISFGFANGNHFISLDLKPDAPIPRVDSRWDTTVSKAAEVWKTPYLDRFDKFEEIMGINLGQRGVVVSL